MNRRSFCHRGFTGGAGILLVGTPSKAGTARPNSPPEQSPIEQIPGDVAAIARELFAAHGRGDTTAIDALYWPGATVSVRLRGPDGRATAMTQTVKQYLEWFAEQHAARETMEFDLTDVAVRHAGPLADTWVTLRVHEKLRDGGRVEVNAVASLQLFRGDEAWKISGHAWHALTSERFPAEQPPNVRER